MTGRPVDQPLAIRFLQPGTPEQVAWFEALDTDPYLNLGRVALPATVHVDPGHSTLLIDRYVVLHESGKPLINGDMLVTAPVVFRVRGGLPPLPRPWAPGD